MNLNSAGDKDKALELLHQMNEVRCKLIKFNTTTEFEIISIIKDIKGKETKDIYGRSTMLIKSLTIKIAQLLKIIFNKCLTEGVFAGNSELQRFCQKMMKTHQIIALYQFYQSYQKF